MPVATVDLRMPYKGNKKSLLVFIENWKSFPPLHGHSEASRGYGQSRMASGSLRKCSDLVRSVGVAQIIGCEYPKIWVPLGVVGMEPLQIMRATSTV